MVSGSSLQFLMPVTRVDMVTRKERKGFSDIALEYPRSIIPKNYGFGISESDTNGITIFLLELDFPIETSSRVHICDRELIKFHNLFPLAYRQFKQGFCLFIGDELTGTVCHPHVLAFLVLLQQFTIDLDN
jgi:hypothetical protein